MLYIAAAVLFPEAEEPLHVRIQNWVGLSAGLNTAEEKIFLPLPEMEPRFLRHPTSSLVTKHNRLLILAAINLRNTQFL
jgi:hypothetical protein